MTIGAWLAERTPAPPAELLERLRACLGARVNDPASALPEAAVTTAEEVLGRLLAAGDTTRATALDLLVVDALVTYAFEAAAEDPSSIADRARAAMERLSALGASAS